MSHRILALTILFAASAACDRQEDAPAKADGAETAGQDIPAGDKVAALPEGQRNAVFIRAIRDAGLACQGVEKSVRAGNYRDLPVWTATCSDGTNYTIVVPRTGVAQIMNADELKLVER